MFPVSVSVEDGLSRYLREIRQFPMLEAQEEYMLTKRYLEHKDMIAAERLITSHLRLVARVAMGYRGYGLPIAEVISEGNVGLMQAVKRFKPDKGFRLATYALWWIKAAIQEYILRTWSLVKIGTTAAQKRLFFKLRQAKSRIRALNDWDLRPDQVEVIADNLGVSEGDVVSMNRRLYGDVSLNAQLSVGEDKEDKLEWQDCLVDGSPNQEARFEARQLYDQRKALLESALSNLNHREKRIFEARYLADKPITLESLASVFGVSRERVRQIETRAFDKVKRFVLSETAPARTAKT